MNVTQAEKAAVTAFFLLHITLSHIVLPWTDRREIFPFFNWSLFTLKGDYTKIPEMEIFLPDGGRLTNRDFPPALSRDFYQTADRVFSTRNEEEKRRRLKRLLLRANEQMKSLKKPDPLQILSKRGKDIVSRKNPLDSPYPERKNGPQQQGAGSAQEGTIEAPLRFTLYESSVNLKEYARRTAVKKETLRARGLFQPKTGEIVYESGAFEKKNRLRKPLAAAPFERAESFPATEKSFPYDRNIVSSRTFPLSSKSRPRTA